MTGLYAPLSPVARWTCPPEPKANIKAKYKPELTLTIRLLLKARRLRRWLARTITIAMRGTEWWPGATSTRCIHTPTIIP